MRFAQEVLEVPSRLKLWILHVNRVVGVEQLRRCRRRRGRGRRCGRGRRNRRRFGSLDAERAGIVGQTAGFDVVQLQMTVQSIAYRISSTL